MLPNLEIREFRTFRHLRIERLGRVNLIVGKNNAGKSSLLEALWLYAYQGAPWVIEEILLSRDEIRAESERLPSSVRRDRLARETPRAYLDYESLVHGRKATPAGLPIQIGPIDAKEATLTIAFGWFRDRNEPEGFRRELVDANAEDILPDLRPALTIQDGTQPRGVIPIDESLRSTERSRMRPRSAFLRATNTFYVPSNGLRASQIAMLWDQVALTDLEEDLLSCLRIIDPELERLALVEDPASTYERIPVIRTRSFDRPIPLRSMGDGMNRLLGISLALTNARDGSLLVDEIENGIHYSVQPEIWRLIFEVAHRLNVQVFATSHSLDAIEAFQLAASANKEVTGELIRLEERKGKIRAVLFDEQDLEIVTDRQIEVR